MPNSKLKIRSQEPGNGLIPTSLVSLCDVLAENAVRTVPFELLDEVTAELITNVSRRCQVKFGHGYFPAGYLMEVRNKVMDMESRGAVIMQRNRGNCEFLYNQLQEA